MLPARSYVYHHVDPRTLEVRYVGSGTGGRAWSCTYSPKSQNGRRGNRSLDHHAWLVSLFDEGFTMGDIVKIVAQGLTSTEARRIEKEQIAANKDQPLFNRPFGVHALKLTDIQVQEAATLRADNVPYHVIAGRFNVSAMTIHRALNNQTEGYRS